MNIYAEPQGRTDYEKFKWIIAEIDHLINEYVSCFDDEFKIWHIKTGISVPQHNVSLHIKNVFVFLRSSGVELSAFVLGHGKIHLEKSKVERERIAPAAKGTRFTQSFYFRNICLFFF